MRGIGETNNKEGVGGRVGQQASVRGGPSLRWSRVFSGADQSGSGFRPPELSWRMWEVTRTHQVVLDRPFVYVPVREGVAARVPLGLFRHGARKVSRRPSRRQPSLELALRKEPLPPLCSPSPLDAAGPPTTRGCARFPLQRRGSIPDQPGQNSP